MSDEHEVVFRWPHLEPSIVIVTGTFDRWSESTHYLRKGSTGFEGPVKVPWNEKTLYKFIVDGVWMVHEAQPTEPDPDGNINNVYFAPSKPPGLESQAITDVKSMTEAASNTGREAVSASNPIFSNPQLPNTITPSAEAVTHINSDTAKQAHAATIAPVKQLGVTGVVETIKNTGAGLSADKESPETPNDFAHTVAAREGTSSTLSYVASGLGAAIHSVVGVDPINTDQIAILTPISDSVFDMPDNQVKSPPLESKSLTPLATNTNVSDRAKTSTTDQRSDSIISDNPLTIVPVNAAENNIPSKASTPPVPGLSSNEEIPSSEIQKAMGVTVEEPGIPDEPSTHRVIPTELGTPIVGDIGPTKNDEVYPDTELALKSISDQTKSEPAPSSTPTIPKGSRDNIHVAQEPASILPTSETAASTKGEVVQKPISIVSTPTAETATPSSPEPVEAPNTSDTPDTANPKIVPISQQSVELTQKPVLEETSLTTAVIPTGERTSMPTAEEKPHINGHSESPVTPTIGRSAENSVTPSTPKKESHQTSFPSSGSPSSSPSSSKFNTMTSRKKRTSLFGKIKHELHELKHIFSHEKQKGDRK